MQPQYETARNQVPRTVTPVQQTGNDTFRGFEARPISHAQFRPPQSVPRQTQQFGSPYAQQTRPVFRPDQVLTYAEVEAMINARLNPPPPELIAPVQTSQHQMMQQSQQHAFQPQMTPQQSMLHMQNPTPAPQTLHPCEMHPTVDPVTVTGFTTNMADLQTAEEQLNLPRNPKFVDLLDRARKFDGPASQGGGILARRPPH